MKIDAIVVLEGHFPQGLYLGRQELRCHNIGVQDTQGEARIDERASLVVAFGSTLQEHIPLYGMIDTGGCRLPFTQGVSKDCIGSCLESITL